MAASFYTPRVDITLGNTEHFYAHLAGFADFPGFTQVDHYQPLPDDWLIVITDVQDSTAAIDNGKYKQVNALGVASIVAVLNAVKPLKIPYVFGGDGAMACIPLSFIETAKPALIAAKQLAADCFGFTLRIGIVPVADIHRAGREVLVGKYQPHPHYQQAMFYGDGLDYAEKLVKETHTDNPFLVTHETMADEKMFEGFECRWNEIPSPHEETISLLIRVLGNDVGERNRIYQEVLEEINRIYGQEGLYHPLRDQNLSLTPSFELLSIEAGVRTAFQSQWRRVVYLLKLQLLRVVGLWLMTRGVKTQSADWGQYKHNLILNTDYRKFDDLLRMVISGAETQRVRLRTVLEHYRRNRQIVFGIHAAPASLITCIVADYDKEHVHFLDGANGGYTIAAKELKRQLIDLGMTSTTADKYEL
jgi:hypothetical protein